MSIINEMPEISESVSLDGSRDTRTYGLSYKPGGQRQTRTTGASFGQTQGEQHIINAHKAVEEMLERE